MGAEFVPRQCYGGPPKGAGWGRLTPERLFLRHGNDIKRTRDFCSPEARAARLDRLEQMLAVLEHYAQHGETEHIRVAAAERAAQRLIDADKYAMFLERVLAESESATPDEKPRITVVLRDADP